MPIIPVEWPFNPLFLEGMNMKTQPDFIISPSLLQQHIKLIDGTIFVN